MERSRFVVLVVGCSAAGCGGTTAGERHSVDQTATGGTHGGSGDAPSAGGILGSGDANGDSGAGAPSAGGVSATGGIPNTGGTVTAQCGCAPVTLVSDQLGPSSIAMDATSVYWVITDSLGTSVQSIMRMPLTGGTPARVVAAQEDLQFIAVDATSIYWLAHGSILKAPSAGGPSVLLVPTITDSDVFVYAEGFALDAANVYWTTQDGDANGAVFKAPIDGGDPVRLATLPAAGPMEITVDATHVYWVNVSENSPTVMRVPIAGGSATPVAPTGPPYPIGIAVDQNSVYWTRYDQSPVVTGSDYGATLVYAPLTGGAPVELAARHARPMALASDGTDLYWGIYSTLIVTGGGSATDGALLKTTRGGVTTTIAEGMNPSRIAANGANVCWTAADWISFGGLGSVMCLGRCETDSKCL